MCVCVCVCVCVCELCGYGRSKYLSAVYCGNSVCDQNTKLIVTVLVSVIKMIMKIGWYSAHGDHFTSVGQSACHCSDPCVIGVAYRSSGGTCSQLCHLPCLSA